MTTISSKTILRSRNLAAPDKVASTFLLRYPRWIHAEGRTHRLLDIGEDFQISVPTPSLMECDDLSRNASSSRAIPVEKLIQDVLDDPAIPLFWGKNERGMQAREELPPHLIQIAKEEWLGAMHDAIGRARRIANLDHALQIGAHKQIVNRLLEPFSHITVLVTATEWENFIELRDHGDAEPHIAMLAREIRKCLDNDPIQDLKPGEWHLPFANDEASLRAAEAWAVKPYLEDGDTAGAHIDEEDIQRPLIKLSVSRCASTSYKTVDGFDMTLDRAVALHDKLVSSKPIHASPAEHVCQADGVKLIPNPNRITRDMVPVWEHPEQHANFVGFRQYRHMLPVAA